MRDPSPEFTLADVSWLTALARALTRDGALADDLVQETWLAASRSKAPSGISRPWLARVLRRLHLRALRTERRRAARERAASSDEAQGGASELVERTELQRTLADCLLGLEEPYRTTLMQVAFEERTPREIAKSESVSVDSVRRRLRKARELYREKLERDYGRDWRHWYAALVPYAELPLPGEVSIASAAASWRLSSIPLKLGGLVVGNTLLLTLSAALAVVLTVSMGLLGGDETDPDVGLSASRDDGGASDVELVAIGAVEETGAGRREADVAPRATTDASVERAEPSASFVLSGTLVMSDASGLRFPTTSGEFSLWTSTGIVRVPVTRGTWQVELAPDQRIDFNVRHDAELVVDGRAGWFTAGTEPFKGESVIAQDAEIALLGRWVRPHRIDVLDAETREHLSGVQILESGYRSTSFPHPDPERAGEPVHENALSPVQIEPRGRYRNVYLIGCEGYAWTQIELDHTEGGETEVLLSPGADLDVVFGGTHVGDVEFAILAAGDSALRSEREVNSADRLRFRGLPPGRYVLAARADLRAQEVRKEVEVERGRVEVLLDVPAYAETRAPVAGTLVIAPSAEATVTSLMFHERVQWGLRPEDRGGNMAKRIPLSSMKRVEDGLRFDAGELFVGTYDVSLEGASWSSTLELGPGGATDLRFEVETQGVAFVRLVQAGTSTLIEDLDGNPWNDPQFELNEDVVASYVESRQAWRIQGPIGRVRGKISWFYDYGPKEIDLDLQAEPVEVEVEIERLTTFRVALYDGDERVEIAMPWIALIEATDASTLEPSSRGVALLSDGWGIAVEQPGRHVISFGELDGFAPIPDVTIDLERGQHRELRVDLQRK